MTIVKKLRIMALMSAGTAFIFVFFFAVAFRMQSEAQARMTASDAIMKAASEINIVGSHYLMSPGDATRIQWVRTYDSLVGTLERMPVKEAEDRAIVEGMLSILARMKELFAELAAASEQGRFTRPSPLADEMIMLAGDVTIGASSLVAVSDAEIKTLNRRIIITLTVFSLLLVVAVLLTSTALGRSISVPINRLREGADIIGSGNLDYRTGIRSGDEIGGLSESFDHMTESLKAITVSRNELAREIAERKRTEEELERSNRELEYFAYIASHDLQEPLRMISGYVSLLERKYKGRLDDQADKYIHFAVDGAKRMQKLIEGLLAYSRVATRGGRFKRVDLNRVFDEAASNLSAAIRESGAGVTRDELPEVTGEETQLLQLLQNLIGNGIKFRKPDVPPRVHVSARLQESEWLFEVRDNGIGIEKKYFDRVFQIFQRLHTREEYAGTGIGLAVCKRIVERHGGRIWVDSVPGEGTSFFFTVPVR